MATDIYAAGVTLWPMLAGRLPFDFWSHRDMTRHRSEVLRGVPEIRDVAPHVSRTLGRVVRTATTLDPTGRYQSAAEFDGALARLRPVASAIRRTLPHPNHDSCWHVERLRDSRQILVCHTLGRPHTIEVRHMHSNARIVRLCSQPMSLDQARVRLRGVFEALS